MRSIKFNRMFLGKKDKMNKFSMFLILMFGFTGVCSAQTQGGTTFKAVSPIEIVEGVGCYLLDAGERVLDGVGEIVSAPFKAKIYIPRARLYRYEPPRLRLPRIVPMPNRNAVPPYKSRPKANPTRQKLYEPLFKSPFVDNSRLAFRF